MLRLLFSVLFYLLCLQTVSANDLPEDPLNSPSWDVMHERMLNGEAYVFDDRVHVALPALAEDAMNVPVRITTSLHKDIQKMVVFADLNPIQKVLEFEPVRVKPSLSFRIKVEQGTPVRAAVKTADGLWHVGGGWLEAAGGGCTAPSAGRAADNWQETLMNVSSRQWHREDDSGRLRIRIMHPMDTGLADGIPEFYIQHFELIDARQELVARVSTYQPISENPVFTFDYQAGVELPLSLVGRDNNGNRLKTSLPE